MGYTGLVPREYSSGQSRWQGKITKSGNTHLRRLLVEAAWSYRYKPALQGEIKNANKVKIPEFSRFLGRLNTGYIKKIHNDAIQGET
ncbi:transposase [Paenibacillus rhizoplanae]